MPISSTIAKKLMLHFKKGIFSFNKFDILADNEKIHELAVALNSFQEEKPPVKVICMSTAEII